MIRCSNTWLPTRLGAVDGWFRGWTWTSFGKDHSLRHKQSPGSECLFDHPLRLPPFEDIISFFNHATQLLPVLPFTTPMGSCLITINVYLSHDKLLAQSTYVIDLLVRTGWNDGVALAHIFLFLLFIFSISQDNKAHFLVNTDTFFLLYWESKAVFWG